MPAPWPRPRSWACLSWEHVVHNLRTIGPSTTILATDLGQTFNPYVDEGFSIYIEKMLDAGFTEAQLSAMVRDNAAQLLAGGGQ